MEKAAVDTQQTSRIGKLLIEKGWLSPKDLQRALNIQRESGKRLGDTLIQLGMINKKQLDKILVRQRWSRSIFAGLMMATSPMILTACGGENTDEKPPEIAQPPAPTPPTTPPSNTPPTVDAGSDVDVESDIEVTFNALASDIDGTVESLQWTQISGNSVNLTNASSAQASFVTPPLSNPDLAETFVFEVTATDNDGASETDTVNVTVSPAPPTINESPTVDSGSDLSAEENTIVELYATADDSDGTIESVLWTQMSGEPLNLNNANSFQSSFTAPLLISSNTDETYIFQVTVTDNQGASQSDTVSVTVTPTPTVNEAPIVNASEDLSVEQNTQVQLTANASDADGSIESIEWTQISGEPVNITVASSAQASFISPSLLDPEVAEIFVFQVTVTDNEGATQTDTVSITVNPAIQDNGIATVSWNAPTENTDSTELNNLTGFIIYYGESSDNLNQSVTVDDAATYAYVFENLSPSNTYYFAVSAVNSFGVESEKSNIVSKTIGG